MADDDRSHGAEPTDFSPPDDALQQRTVKAKRGYRATEARTPQPDAHSTEHRARAVDPATLSQETVFGRLRARRMQAGEGS